MTAVTLSPGFRVLIPRFARDALKLRPGFSIVSRFLGHPETEHVR